LNEREITDISSAAIAADEYLLTHTQSFAHDKRKMPKLDNDKSDKGYTLNDKCPQPSPHISSKQTGGQTVKVTKPWSEATCNYCHRKGNFKSNCWSLQNKTKTNKTHCTFAEL
jgi:hypothetical protein